MSLSVGLLSAGFSLTTGESFLSLSSQDLASHCHLVNIVTSVTTIDIFVSMSSEMWFPTIGLLSLSLQ
jgi:hypothetical protein